MKLPKLTKRRKGMIISLLVFAIGPLFLIPMKIWPGVTISMIGWGVALIFETAGSLFFVTYLNQKETEL